MLCPGSTTERTPCPHSFLPEELTTLHIPNVSLPLNQPLISSPKPLPVHLPSPGLCQPEVQLSARSFHLVSCTGSCRGREKRGAEHED